jgi:hypothetical protein
VSHNTQLRLTFLKNSKGQWQLVDKRIVERTQKERETRPEVTAMPDDSVLSPESELEPIT